MKKQLLLLLLSSVFYMCAMAQTAKIKGVIYDTINKQTLTNTSISLLREKDSILYKFTRSGTKGNFELQSLRAGAYYLFITHPTYADYADKIQLTDTSVLDLGNVIITLKANLLMDVIVKSKISAIRINGDTTEFKADSFAVREGASVEEMLKKLPGIQVDKDGKITAMGEKVNKVLVDGEEFFGDDPTIATKNLQASDIDKVQVFDKKSDQATFTGIDDGVRDKTINLKMKDNKKKGYFGKIDLGSGLDDRWSNSLMLNSFRAKRKLSAYGIMSSTGKTGLDWNERDQYGSSGDGPEYDEDNGYFFFSGDGDDLSNSSYYGEGLPKSWSAGLNYSNKFNDDKQNLNGSYRYNKLNTEGAGSNLSQLITGENVFTTRESGNTFSSRQRHSMNGTYEWNIDSSTSLKIKAIGYTGKTNSLSVNNSQAVNSLGVITNNSLRNYTSIGDNSNLVASILLRHKFKKIGRTVSLNTEQRNNETNSEGYLLAAIDTLDSAGDLIHSLTDQKKNNGSTSSSISSKIVYTEPLSKKVFVEINYNFRQSNSDAERLTYNKDGAGKYQNLSDTFSNHYKFKVTTNSGGLFFKYNGKKTTMSAGTDIAFADFSQTDLFSTLVTKRSFTNFFPRANYTYKFNASSRFNIGYSGRTQQPSIEQIQPVPDNSNPLNITIGNPLLKQQFNHNLNINFNSFKVLSQRGFYIYSNITSQQNAIVTNSTISDTTGKIVNQYINANGNYNYYFGGQYFIKLKKLNANFNMGLNANGTRFNSFVNGLKNTTVNNAPGIDLGLGKDKENKYNIYLRAGYNYNFSTTKIVTEEIKTNYWTMNYDLNYTVQMPHKFELNTELEANIRQKTALFSENNNVFVWNAYIGRKFLKNDKGIIKFVAHDILNQNIGYSRYVSANQISERNYQTITRYFMLSFVWNFTKAPPAPVAEQK
ncbi:MAG: outer membrane beta-barrel protein [Panacibacter sp.]